MVQAGIGNVAAVTGAASGIGQAATSRLLDGLDGIWTVSGQRHADASGAIGGKLNALVRCTGVLLTALLADMAVEEFSNFSVTPISAAVDGGTQAAVVPPCFP